MCFSSLCVCVDLCVNPNPGIAGFESVLPHKAEVKLVDVWLFVLVCVCAWVCVCTHTPCRRMASTAFCSLSYLPFSLDLYLFLSLPLHGKHAHFGVVTRTPCAQPN